MVLSCPHDKEDLKPRGLPFQGFPAGSQEACQGPREETAEPIRMEAGTDHVKRDFRPPEVLGLGEEEQGVWGESPISTPSCSPFPPRATCDVPAPMPPSTTPPPRLLLAD